MSTESSQKRAKREALESLKRFHSGLEDVGEDEIAALLDEGLVMREP